MKWINCWLAWLSVQLFAIDEHKSFGSSYAPFCCKGKYNGRHSKNHMIPGFFVPKWVFSSIHSGSAIAMSTFSPNEIDALSPFLENENNDEDDEEQSSTLPLTNAILRISYDGSQFTGWSAANRNNDSSSRKRRRRRGRRGGVEQFHDAQLPTGFVRSVEGILKDDLAKLYGNVDPNTRIVVEGCSRTDKGVHATCMIAQIYCLKKGYSTRASSLESKNGDDDINDKTTNTNHMVITGKRIPHPTSPTDNSCFEAIPMDGNLSRVAFALNRMRPLDFQITGISPAPRMKDGEIFHASLSSKLKIYEYQISTGYLSDPSQRRVVWHVGSSDLDLEKIQKACDLLRGRHDFSAFQGAARGATDKRKRAERKENEDLASSSSTSSNGSFCMLYDLQINLLHPVNVHEDYHFPGVDPPLRYHNIVVKGDRFLYKMVRFIVGSLVAVGKGKLSCDDIERALKTGSWGIPDDPGGRRKQFKCAPPHGLTLKHIDYGDEVSFDWQPLRDMKE